MTRDLPDLTAFDVYRFCQFLKPSMDCDCVEWQGTISNGYGQFKVDGQSFFAHRIAYWLATKTKPPINLEVCHQCNNRKCCNPEHLYLDTHKGNMDYAASLGRMQGSRKLTSGDVLEIRNRASQGNTVKTLAEDYKLATVTIRSIITHRSWKNVGGPVTKRKGGSSKLTPEQVQFILNSSLKGAELAHHFKVSPATISMVKTGKIFQNGHPGDLLEV